MCRHISSQSACTLLLSESRINDDQNHYLGLVISICSYENALQRRSGIIASNFANGTLFLSKATCLAVKELPPLYQNCRGKCRCTFDYFHFCPWLPLLKGVTHPFIYCSTCEVVHPHPAEAAVHPVNWRLCKHALLLPFRSPLLLPSVPLTAKDLFSRASLLGCLEATFSKCPGKRVLIVCFSLLYVSFCPCLVLRGLSFSKAVKQRFVVLSPLCFLVCVFILTVPQTMQRCRGVIGWMCCFVPEKILIMHFTRFPGRMSLVVASRN